MCFMLINWAWILASLYITGWFFCHAAVSRLAGIQGEFWERVDVTLLLGTAATAFFVQVYSIFNNISYLAYGIQFLVVLAVCFRYHKDICRSVKKTVFPVRRHFAVIAGVLFLYFLFISTMRSSNWDDYLYHYQAVRWIEKYGTVAGLGNLHYRFSYNTSMFHLQALYSWASFPFMKQGIYGLAGFASCLFCLHFLAGFYKAVKVKKRPFGLTAMINLFGLAYILNRTQLIPGLHTDLCPHMLIIYIFGTWAECYEDGNMDLEQYSYLAVLSVYAVTLNLSASMGIFFVIYPVYKYLRQRRYKAAAGLLSVSFITIAPMFVRNIISSGYILFPSSFPDLFDVKWKLTESKLRNYREAVRIWGRNLPDLLEADSSNWAELAHMPFHKWLPHWFERADRMCQVLFICSVVMTACFFIFCIAKIAGRKFLDVTDFMFLIVVMHFSLWLFQAPDERFGIDYMWILVLMFVWKVIPGKMAVPYYVLKAVLCFGIYSICMETEFDASLLAVPSLAEFPEEYDRITLGRGQGEKIDIYWPLNYGAGGYDPFPCTPYEADARNLRMLGDTVREGFYSILER